MQIIACGLSNMQDEIRNGALTHFDPVMGFSEPDHDAYQECKNGHLSGYTVIAAYTANFGGNHARGCTPCYSSLWTLFCTEAETFTEVIRLCPLFLSYYAQSKFMSSIRVKPEYCFQLSMVLPLRSLKAYRVLCLVG